MGTSVAFIDALSSYPDWGELLWGKTNTNFKAENKKPNSFAVKSEGAAGAFFIVAEGHGITFNAGDQVTGGFVSSFRFTDPDGRTGITVTGFAEVGAAEFFQAVINDNSTVPDGRYQYLVSLLDDATKVVGSGNGESIEVGAGNDAIGGKSGDDTVYKWKTGSLNYNGGGGSDWLVFQAATGIINPAGLTTQLVVDLRTGAGANPFGGAALKLTSVENVIGTDQADRLTGNNAANTFGDGVFDTGADIINALGGNDRVELAEDTFFETGGKRVNGGTGVDTLAVNMGLGNVSGPHILDLNNQANNRGVFEDDILVNFEIFEPGAGFYSPTGAFIFRDTDAGHTVTALGLQNTITLNGGNDTLRMNDISNAPKVNANGGAGVDTLVITRLLDGANRLDLTKPSTNSGIFDDSAFVNFEVFTAGPIPALGAATLVFRGNGAGQTVTGYDPIGIFGASGDNLRGEGGDDTLNGLGGRDRLDGGAGDDVLAGGRHNDMLTGGAGKDSFLFNTTLAATEEHRDKIVDFSVAADTIRIDNAFFAGVGGNGGLAALRFHTGANAQDPDDRIIYNAATGALLHDSNGNAAGGETQFATLAKNLALTAADFVVV